MEYEIENMLVRHEMVNRNTIFAGDFNQYLRSFKRIFQKFRYVVSNFVRTRTAENGREVDMMASRHNPLYSLHEL